MTRCGFRSSSPSTQESLRLVVVTRSPGNVSGTRLESRQLYCMAAQVRVRRRTYFDPDRYSVTLFDQRGCGRSVPLASEPDIDLSTITTQHLIGDIEALRRLHGVDRWLVFGGSWGSTLALAYAVEHPSRVSELVLWGVTTTTRHEVDWLTWSMGEIYPEAFAGLLALVPGLELGGNLPAAYNCLLMSHHADLRDHAARSWCAWEQRLATLHGSPKPSPRYDDATFRLG